MLLKYMFRGDLMRSVGKTDIGLVRKINEDSFLCEKLESSEDSYLHIVADGMGGHNAGEVASSMAVQEIAAYIEGSIETLKLGDREIQDLIRNAILHANDKVYKTSIVKSNCLGMGTTLSMVLVKDHRLYIGHVGDSRVYLIRDNAIIRLTEDHSLVAELIKAGTIKPEEANSHPQKNVITRALGTEYTLEPDISLYDMQDGDFILICTDGLSNAVYEEDMINAIVTTSDLNDACELLVNKAKESGGFDNITAVVIHMCKGGDYNGR
jgi:PPM family protein phosphatase